MIEIISATYGDASVTSISGSRVDVKSQVSSQISTDGQTLVINVSPANVGVTDPAPQKTKSLIVSFRVNGEQTSRTTYDGSTFAVSAPSYVPKTPAGYVLSLIGDVWTNGATALSVFLYFFSISLAYHLGGVAMGAAATLMPFSTFWFFAPLLFVISAFNGEVYWVPVRPVIMMGGRRRRR